MGCCPELGACGVGLFLDGVHDAGIGKPLGYGVHVGRSVFQRAVNRFGRLADLVREARQVLHDNTVARIEDDRCGLVQCLVETRSGAFNSVMDLRSKVGQTILDARRYCCDAVGEVVCGTLEPLLDPGRCGIQAMLQAGNCPVHGCFHAGAAQSLAFSTALLTDCSRSRAIRSDFFTTTSRLM